MNSVLKSGRSLRRLWSLLGIAALALLASCGGGTLENAFSPRRVVVFGDEASVITSVNGSAALKYSVNYLDTSVTPAAISCSLYPVWTQYLANALNLPFPSCVASGTNAPSVMHAAIGARVADVSAQIDAHLASGDSFTNRDLVTIMVGANDIVDEYKLYAGGTQDIGTSQSALSQRAVAVSALVQRVVSAGGKVLIATVPNQGLTPAYVGNGQASTDLTTLSKTFNDALRTALVNYSGRDVGLILVDEIVRLDAVYPGSYNLSNVTNALCAVPDTASLVSVPCTSASLSSPGTDPGTWLWAGNSMLGPTANSQIGSQAYSRATNNPF